jgi:hypothetical protein
MSLYILQALSLDLVAVKYTPEKNPQCFNDLWILTLRRRRYKNERLMSSLTED